MSTSDHASCVDSSHDHSPYSINLPPTTPLFSVESKNSHKLNVTKAIGVSSRNMKF